ncbi:MAG: adenosylcobinamide-GDP ribazoletransferase [Acidimicrobiia bacterium]|nr:adenosylcobinamide-GDP ribazoletransferase [Acidimicrobiia bacterium]MXX45672.1 adenosylcobinamide-GDP ribazoletransferase [Acidimicrobiia bacterium]MYA39520.1 adenosylcobinamide-GDP ribazoletransferase [Acidimicrobiia bacterium]MYB78992.1 adenosylcobinamide-GDP ribazoletransferase [Acidimicrobiia bacterium]MYH06809.1 adenosylcobinamide-GDP ribazoletransferase [Acidimicrobiia bacterium]
MSVPNGHFRPGRRLQSPRRQAVVSGLRSALGFLTIIPVGSGYRTGTGGLSSARAWFPAVGVLLGFALAGIDLLLRWVYMAGSGADAQAHPTRHILTAVVLVTALVAMTRALHLDGFMDTCDALLGGSSPEHRRRILKDPEVGAFAVAGVVCLLLLKVAAVSALPDQVRPWILMLVPCISRGGMLLVMEMFPYVGGDGLGAAFLKRPGRWQLIFGTTLALLAGFALAGPWSLVLLALAFLAAWSIGAFATRLLGGVTGDIYGAVNETVEAVAFLCAVLLSVGAPNVLIPSWYP